METAHIINLIVINDGQEKRREDIVGLHRQLFTAIKIRYRTSVKSWRTGQFFTRGLEHLCPKKYYDSARKTAHLTLPNTMN